MKIVFLGVGTNLGNRENNLKDAVAGIEKHIGHVTKFSSVYETEPWGFNTRDQFLNMVLKVETKLLPSGLLERVLMIESNLGRVRSETHYTSRLIDIDILLFEDLIIDEKNLIIPHPHMHKRRFVLVPLCEIEPEYVHPVLHKTVATLLESCTDTGKVLKV